MITSHEIFETFKMIEEEKLDIRTITLGISLRDCAGSESKNVREKIYNKITKYAEHLVTVAEDIEVEYGIPIINKRISVTPISFIAESSDEEDYVKFAEVLDQTAESTGVDFIGGFSSLVHKGYTAGDSKLLAALPEALSKTSRVCSSVNVATTKAGINMNAVAQMGQVIKETADKTAQNEGIGCAKLVVFANVPEDNPFMAGAFHGIGESECAINVGISGPGVVKSALENVRGKDFDTVSETIKKTTFKITRAGQLVAREASKRLNIPYGIIDLSLAPTPAIGDSVAKIIEEMGIECCGAPGSIAALAILNDAVKKGGTMASSHVGGLSGSFIPVSEDAGMIDAAQKGALSLEMLEAMTAVCSVGIDMVAVPGTTSAETVAAIIADEISIGVANNKTTAVRLIPAPGKTVGDKLEFGGLLGEAPVMNVSNYASHDFVNRGGRIPAPINSLRN